MRLILLLAALFPPAAACAQQTPPASAPAPPILRSGETMSGQKLVLPDGPVELVVSVRELPAGGALPVHRHAWPRYVYVERGRIRVVNHDAGITRDFAPGEVMIEAIGQWHEGRVIGDEPVRLVVFDQMPPGAGNMELKPD